MKFTKRILALLMAVTLLAGLGVSALAVDISLSGANAGSTYKAYQLLTLEMIKICTYTGHGDDDHTDECYLYNYSVNQTYNDVIVAVLKDEFDVDFPITLTNSQINSRIVATIENMDELGIREFANAVYLYMRDTDINDLLASSDGSVTVDEGADAAVIENLSEGYYLIVETGLSASNASYSLAMLATAGAVAIKIEAKSETPSVEKEVSDGTKKEAQPQGSEQPVEEEVYSKYVDVNIGDEVYFRVTGTLPSNYFSEYETYYYAFHDTMSHGLDYVDGSAKVQVDIGGVLYELPEDFFDIEVSEDVLPKKTTITVIAEDLVALKVETSIDAENSNAPVYEDIDSSWKFVLTYSAILNDDAVMGNPGNMNSVTLKYSNDPYWAGNGKRSEPPKGETPPETAYVFTFRLDVDKTNVYTDDSDEGDRIMLAGAEFVLYRLNAAEKKEYYTGGIKVTTGEGNEAVTETVYWLVYEDEDEDEVPTLTSDEDGEFTVKGLDQGTYYLEEKNAPAGYNLLEYPLQLIVAAAYDIDTNMVTGLTITVNYGEDYTNPYKYETLSNNIPSSDTTNFSLVKIEVQNGSGVELPDTGGIGTTIFYVIGSILVLVSIVLFVTKKRMNDQK